MNPNPEPKEPVAKEIPTPRTDASTLEYREYIGGGLPDEPCKHSVCATAHIPAMSPATPVSNAAPENVPTISGSRPDLLPLSGSWKTKCAVCGKIYDNGVGSTPCCGALQYILGSDSGNEATPETDAQFAQIQTAKQAADFAKNLEVARNTALRELTAANKALAYIKDRVRCDEDFDADDIVRIIEDRIGRYSQSAEWFYSAAAKEQISELHRELAAAQETIAQLRRDREAAEQDRELWFHSFNRSQEEFGKLKTAALLLHGLLCEVTDNCVVADASPSQEEIISRAETACVTFPVAALTPTPETQEGAR